MRRKLPLLAVVGASLLFLLTPHRHPAGDARAHGPGDGHDHAHAGEGPAEVLTAPAEPEPEPAAAPLEPYADLVSRIQSRRGEAALEDVSRAPEELERRMIRDMESLFDRWYGTTWGLGTPQTRVPQEGKVNCGMFVARTLVDAGFVIKASKLQRQPAALIIESLAPRSTIKRWRNEPIERFIKDMKEMGPGLYVIGLDFHVGYVLVREDLDVRFIHASYVTHTVLDEPAATASPLVTSAYRVVGKIMQREMLERWAAGERIAVRGNW